MVPPAEVVLWLLANQWASVMIKDLVPVSELLGGKIVESQGVALLGRCTEIACDPSEGSVLGPPLRKSGHRKFLLKADARSRGAGRSLVGKEGKHGIFVESCSTSSEALMIDHGIHADTATPGLDQTMNQGRTDSSGGRSEVSMKV